MTGEMSTEGAKVAASWAAGFPEVVWEESHTQTVARVPLEQWSEFCAAAKEAGFEMCVDVTAVDHPRDRVFELVANLISLCRVERVRMITEVSRVEPVAPSLTPLWPGAGFAEREVYDMFGIVFEGHPDLTRILMPDEWVGHPLRKDFGVGSVPVQFKESHRVE